MSGNASARMRQPPPPTDGLATATFSLAAQLANSIIPSQPPLLVITPITTPGVRWDTFSQDSNTYDLVGRLGDGMKLDEFVSFTGQLDDQGLPNGQGALVGYDYYEGEFVHGKRDGFGTSYHDGGMALRYEGEFVSDKPHGFGVAYRRPTEWDTGGPLLFVGEWRGGEPVDGTEYDANGDIAYEGTYVDGGRGQLMNPMAMVSVEYDETTRTGKSPVLTSLAVVVGMLMLHRRRQRDLRLRVAATAGKQREMRQRQIYETALEQRARFNENKIDALPVNVRRQLLQLAVQGSDDPCMAIDKFCRASMGMCNEDDIWRFALRLVGFVATGEVATNPRRVFYGYCGSFSKIERMSLLRRPLDSPTASVSSLTPREPEPPRTLIELPDDALEQILRAVAEGGPSQACQAVQAFCRTIRCDDDLFAAVLETLGWPAPTDGRTSRAAFYEVCGRLVGGLKQIERLSDDDAMKFMDGKDPTDFSFLPLWDAVLARFGLERRQPVLQVTQANIRDVVFFRWGRREKLQIVADYGPLELWDVSHITEMNRLFLNMDDLKIDLKLWDVSKVTTMEGLFYGCDNFNRDLPWDTSSVESMERMFTHCRAFNGDISRWDTSKVRNMSGMFWDARSFAGDLNTWDVRNVVTFDAMFLRSYAMRRHLLSTWPAQNQLVMGDPGVFYIDYHETMA